MATSIPASLHISRANVATVTISTTSLLSFPPPPHLHLHCRHQHRISKSLSAWNLPWILWPSLLPPSRSHSALTGGLLSLQATYSLAGQIFMNSTPCLGRAILSLHVILCGGPSFNKSLISEENSQSLHPEFYLPRNLWKSWASFLPQFLVF